MDLCHFQNLYPGMTFSIIGRGPSVAKYAPDGSISVGLNSYWRTVPSVSYCVFLDSGMVPLINEEMPARQAAVAYFTIPRPKRYGEIKYDTVYVPPITNIRRFVDEKFGWTHDFDKPVPTWHASVCFAIVLCVGMGAKAINLYGIDMEKGKGYESQRPILAKLLRMLREEEPEIRIRRIL